MTDFQDVAEANEAASASGARAASADETDHSVRDSQPFPGAGVRQAEQRATENANAALDATEQLAEAERQRDEDAMERGQLARAYDDERERAEVLSRQVTEISAYGDRDADWLERNAYTVLASVIVSARAATGTDEEKIVFERVVYLGES